MPLIVLSVLLQIACCVHVVRSGRPHYWIYIVIIGSFLGVAVYFFAEVLPNLHRDPVARRVAQNVRQKVDPEHGKRRAARQLDIADTLENRRRLAEQSMGSGDYQQALELYRNSLSGMYKTDPTLMLGLAQAQFALELPVEARATLEALIAANPTYRSSDGHLLYARAVEASGDLEKALEEYEAVVQGVPGRGSARALRAVAAAPRTHSARNRGVRRSRSSARRSRRSITSATSAHGSRSPSARCRIAPPNRNTPDGGGRAMTTASKLSIALPDVGREAPIFVALQRRPGFHGPAARARGDARVRERGLRAIHVHHGLNDQADAWAAHCERVCASLGVPLHVAHVVVDRKSKLGLEAAAREARQAALAAEMDDGALLALAHHRDDQAETFLLRALRASGPDGLAAMRRLAALRERLAVAAVARCAARHVARVRDGARPRLDRRPRQRNPGARPQLPAPQVLPLLRERWPHADAALARSAALSARSRRPARRRRRAGARTGAHRRPARARDRSLARAACRASRACVAALDPRTRPAAACPPKASRRSNATWRPTRPTPTSVSNGPAPNSAVGATAGARHPFPQRCLPIGPTSGTAACR